MPSPPSWGGAGLAEVAQAVRMPGRRVHLALRRWSQRPAIDRWALDFRQLSFRHVTRVLPSHDGSIFCRSRLLGRRLFPRPFGFREAVDPRISSASYPSTMGMLHALLRRTGRWRQSGSG
jgi:hypothetical protein